MKRSSLRWNAIASCLFLSFFVASFSLPSSAQIAASPTALNFGNVPVGTRSTLTGVFTNADTDNVTISRVSVSGTNFTLSGMALPSNASSRSNCQVHHDIRAFRGGRSVGDY